MNDPDILLFAHRIHAPTATGIGRYVTGLASAIAARPTPFSYALASTREGGPNTVAPLPVLRVPWPRRAVHLAWCLAQRPSLDRLVGRPRLLHVLSPFVPVPSRAPTVYTFHDLMPILFPEWFPPAERLAFRLAARHAARSAAHIVTSSESTATSVVDHLSIDRGRITVVYPGIAGEFSAPIDATAVGRACRRAGVEHGRYVIAVGQISPRKNLATLMRAMVDVADVDLLVVGSSGPGAEAVEAEAKSLGIRRRVVMAGYVPGPNLPALVSGAIALAHPSLYEGFGFPPLEAMAMGVPTVSSRTGALAEVVGDGGLLVDAHDPEEWTVALRSLLGHSVEREALRAAGRRRAACFTWDKAAIEVIALHDQLI